MDLADAAIVVRRKRLRLASGEVIEDGPKSRAGRRKVALPAVLVADLDHHRELFCAGATPDDYVFTSPEGTPIERSNFRYRVWLPATEAADLPGLRFHDLRHTAGTLAARTGATTKELMARLGHASPRASLIYQHAAEAETAASPKASTVWQSTPGWPLCLTTHNRLPRHRAVGCSSTR